MADKYQDEACPLLADGGSVNRPGATAALHQPAAEIKPSDAQRLTLISCTSFSLLTTAGIVTVGFGPAWVAYGLFALAASSAAVPVVYCLKRACCPSFSLFKTVLPHPASTNNTVPFETYS